MTGVLIFQKELCKFFQSFKSKISNINIKIWWINQNILGGKMTMNSCFIFCMDLIHSFCNVPKRFRLKDLQCNLVFVSSWKNLSRFMDIFKKRNLLRHQYVHHIVLLVKTQSADRKQVFVVQMPKKSYRDSTLL